MFSHIAIFYDLRSSFLYAVDFHIRSHEFQIVQPMEIS